MKKKFRSTKFVAGLLDNGRLVLIQEWGSVVRCGVVMCTGTLTDNEDGTFVVNLGSA
jgi:hypothetical protein